MAVKDLTEERLKGYKRTAYQQACQLGLEDRSTNSFKVHNYLYTFDDNNLTRYLVFWFKTYYAPNPYVKSDATTPKTRTEFWLEKFNKNVKNDQIKQEKLRELGWKVIVIWECELKRSFQETMDKVEKELT